MQIPSFDGWPQGGIRLFGRQVPAVAAVCGAAVLLSSCYTKYELGFPGPYPAAGYHTYFEEDLPITVFYPDTYPRMENLPVVIFNAGFIQPRATYEGYGRQLAQWGYVAVIRAYASLGLIGIGDAMVDTHVAQSRRLLDWLADENERPDSPLFGMVDTNNVGVTGHSLGATVAMSTALAEPRVRAAVNLDATYDGAEFNKLDDLAFCQAAILYIAAASGGWCSQAPGSQRRLYDYTPAPTVQVTIEGADHIDFMDTPIGLYNTASIACPQGSADAQLVRDLATKYMVAWFNVHLKGMTEFADYYNGAAADADRDAGLAKFQCRLED